MSANELLVTSAVVTLFVTFIIAVANWRASNAARAAAEQSKHMMTAQILMATMHEYFSDTMANDLRLLRECSTVYGEDFPWAWIQARKINDANSILYDNARRRTKRYFYIVFELFDAGVIDQPVFIRAVNREGLAARGKSPLSGDQLNPAGAPPAYAAAISCAPNSSRQTA